MENSMYLMIDHYDSFVYNLVSYFEELLCDLQVVQSDDCDIKWIEDRIKENVLEGIILSPGPKSPEDCKNSIEIIQKVAGKVPILGVCLGHQMIGKAFGAVILHGGRPMHGKVTPISNNQTGLFETLPASYLVTRYHSLIVEKKSLPACFQVDAVSEEGDIMAMHHKELPVYSVQFHPEAVCTQYGHTLLKNYLKLSKGWWRSREQED